MKYQIRQEPIKEYQDKDAPAVFTVWASDGELRSKIATVRDSEICEEHGDARKFAEAIAIALNAIHESPDDNN